VEFELLEVWEVLHDLAERRVYVRVLAVYGIRHHVARMYGSTMVHTTVAFRKFLERPPAVQVYDPGNTLPGNDYPTLARTSEEYLRTCQLHDLTRNLLYSLNQSVPAVRILPPHFGCDLLR
jgi:hypothetical protein